ncbi:MAG: helix-turn-helix domain-containing protein, partial [Enterococcus sp.]|nr:helix-turn-helix domain-containing protein [Enterococcus sp.]
MTIGEKVKNLRNERGMTLKQLSEATGLSTGFLSQFERGITTIAVEHLATIAALFKVKINYFFEEE